MSFIDAILNIAGLLLWLKWRDKGQEIAGPRISLAGTLRKAGPGESRPWLLLALLALLFARSALYWWLGSAAGWTPRISLGVIAFPFRSDFFGRMFLFSLFSFAVTLGIFYLCMLFLSILNGKNSLNDPMQSVVRVQLGKIHFLPAFVKLLVPCFVMVALWCSLNRPLIAWGMLPAPNSIVHLFEQSAVVGLSVYLVWEFLIVGILLLHLLNSYIYFGAWPFWNFIDNSARQILKPLSWIPLRVGKIDFAPLAGIALVMVAAELASCGLAWLYQRLPI